MRITSNLFAAHLKCPTKCWLRSRGEPDAGNVYADWVRTQTESYRSESAKRLLEGVPETGRVITPPATENPKTAKWRLSVDLLTQTDELESRLHAVERLPSEGRGKPAQFIPIRFVFTNKLTKDDKLLLSFDALVLSDLLGREVNLGRIIHGDDHATVKMKTSAQRSEVRKRVGKIAALLLSQSPPDLVLNRHCSECEFQARCRQKAAEADDLSLLGGLTEMERKKLNGKGTFTIKQYSYAFLPRRRPKRLRHKRERYHHSLKALAIREKKIHIVGSPELKIEGTPVYLDVEGLPDRDFYYLIGVRIRNGESVVQHSLWADEPEDEAKIYAQFLEILRSVEKPVLLYYGSFETEFFEQMGKRYDSPIQAVLEGNKNQTPVNLLSIILGQVYFPTYSNSLKDIASWLGFAWSADDAVPTSSPSPGRRGVACNGRATGSR